MDGASFDAAKASGGRLSLTTEEFKSKYDEVFAWDRTVSRLLVTCSGIRVFPVLFAEQRSYTDFSRPYTTLPHRIEMSSPNYLKSGTLDHGSKVAQIRL